jgi:hypothetical protein
LIVDAGKEAAEIAVAINRTRKLFMRGYNASTESA